MIYISVGSNLGHRITQLQRAVDLLGKRYLQDIQCSIVLETTCILPEDAPPSWNKPFLNMIVSGNSALSPKQLLEGLKIIEREMGRPEKYAKWSPRIIDLDIFLWDDLRINTPLLTIPHPEIQNRPFLIHLLKMMGCSYLETTIPHKCFLKSLTISPKLVGIVNVTSDSFSDGGKFNKPETAIRQALKLVEDGTSVIEIGAQSTKPGVFIKSPEEEYAKLKPVLDGLKSLIENDEITISVDTFWPSIIRKIIENYPISWINNVKGDLDDATLQLMAEHHCKLCIMHSLGIPPRKETILTSGQPPLDFISTWAKKNIEKLLSLGFKQDNIIIDPGIGFGKSTFQNIDILRHFEQLKSLGSPILIGHSRKSYMEIFTRQKAKNRDIETIAISAFIEHKADFLRVHNVEDHMRFFVGLHTLRGVIS